MLLDLLLLVLGLALLLAGGRLLVAGAVQLAGTLGVSELAIGLTVVAFGTSAPELAVNLSAAIQGNAGIAFGNVVGSNIANVALVLGVAALVRSLRIDSTIVNREIPMMLLATAAAIILGLDRLRGEVERYDRADGLILLLLFSVFLYYSISEVAAKRSSDPIAEAAAGSVSTEQFVTATRSGLMVAVGLALLVGGAELTVARAVALAEALGVSRAVIGLSVVALGTSLPELATSFVAARRGSITLAVGNIVGSNIFNLLFILGTTAAITPVDVPHLGGADLAALAGFSCMLLLLLAYAGFMTWRFAA